MSDGFQHDFNRLLNASWRAAERSSWTYGRLGDRTQNWAIDAVERPGFVYVTLGIDGQGEPQIARNDFAGLPKTKQLPIKMREESGVWVIHGIDVNASSPTDYLYGPGGNTYGVPPHTHRLDTGLSYPIESLRLEPARVTWAGGMLVDVFAFRYRAGGGVWKTWLGGTIDLTDAIPLTTGEWGWVLICVDTTTNTLVSVPGATQVYALPLTAAQLDDIVPPEVCIPCGAVKLRNDATDVGTFSYYIEARGWLNIPESVTEIGQISDVEVSAPSDGDVLMYSTFDSIWHATPIQLSIEDLTDVILTTPSAGDLFTYNGSDWVNESADSYIRADGTVPLSDAGPVNWDIGEDNSISADIITARGDTGALVFRDDNAHDAFGVRPGSTYASLDLLGNMVKGAQEPEGLIHLRIDQSYYLLKEVHVVASPVNVTIGSLASSPSAVCQITYAVKSDIGGANGGGMFTILLSDTEVVTVGSVSWTFTMDGTGDLNVEQTAGSAADAYFMLSILYL